MLPAVNPVELVTGRVTLVRGKRFVVAPELACSTIAAVFFVSVVAPKVVSQLELLDPVAIPFPELEEILATYPAL